eukprot:6483269-Amphidinium_carterae.1
MYLLNGANEHCYKIVVLKPGYHSNMAKTIFQVQQRTSKSDSVQNGQECKAVISQLRVMPAKASKLLLHYYVGCSLLWYYYSEQLRRDSIEKRVGKNRLQGLGT